MHTPDSQRRAGNALPGHSAPGPALQQRAPAASQGWPSGSPHGSGATAAPGTAATPLRERTTGRGAWQRSHSCPTDMDIFFLTIAAVPHPPLPHNRGGRRPAGVVFQRGGRTGQAGVLTAHFGPGRAGRAAAPGAPRLRAGRGGAGRGGSLRCAAGPAPLRSAPRPLRALRPALP